MDEKELRALHQRCTRFLSGHYPLRPQQALSDLAAWTDATLAADRYGSGELITSFEAQVAALLGKEAALFLPSGTMAQQIALRLWAEERRSPWVGFHPTSHLELHEYDAYRLLHGLRGVLVGPRDGLMQRADLEAVPESLAVLLLELPQREIGGQLPGWEELVALVEEAQRRGMALHLDGARLWECQPFYGQQHASVPVL